MFGNANIGHLARTNLQVAGMLVYGKEAVVITHWYARTDLDPVLLEHPQDIAAYTKWKEASVVCFGALDRNVWHAPVGDLLRMWRWSDDPRTDNGNSPAKLPRTMWPEPVPPRTNVHVRVDSTGYEFIDRAQQNEDLGNCRLWVHLEGLRLMDNESDADNIDKILALLTAPQHQQADAEKRIVDWLLGLAENEDHGDGTRSQLYAVADGILEGRHR